MSALRKDFLLWFSTIARVYILASLLCGVLSFALTRLLRTPHLGHS